MLSVEPSFERPVVHSYPTQCKYLFGIRSDIMNQTITSSSGLSQIKYLVSADHLHLTSMQEKKQESVFFQDPLTEKAKGEREKH